jgi:hypothetical protein
VVRPAGDVGGIDPDDLRRPPSSPTLTLPDPGQVLVTDTAEPDSRSAEALDLLGSLAYSEAASSTK